MASDLPPTLDPAAAARWQRAAPAESPWLHEEVARRMEERLEWIRLAPAAWADWEAVRGGMEGHARVAARYPRSRSYVLEHAPHRVEAARRALAAPWWKRWRGAAVDIGTAPATPVQMLWANMALHLSARPQELLAAWHRLLATDGFLMFSCLGPDTLRELRAVYAQQGWPPPAHEFTDMHDWGDMLVQGGFAEPVMDMERITLTFDTPARLLAELRGLGINLHKGRFAALRGRGWRARLEEAIAAGPRDADGRLSLAFEIIYGHAMKPLPRPRMGEQSAVSLDDMRTLLRAGGRGPAGSP